MKINITAIILTLILLFSIGCRGLSYDEQDAQDDIRQDLVGFILGLKEAPQPERLDQKWEPGIRHMLDNPQPITAEIAAELE